jgi:cytochrome c oxidase subunit II
MTSLLVIIVLLLLAVAIWQITKIFDLTQIGSTNESTQIANNKDNNIQGYLMFGFLVFLYVFTIYGLFKWSHLVLDNPASEHGADYDNLMWITFGVIFFVQAITQILLHYFAFKYRGAEGKKAVFFADNDRLEFIWTIIPVFVLAGLILYGLYTWTNIMFVDEDEEVMIVELYAKQFGWEARYSGSDNTLGKANVRLIDGVNTLGVDVEDPNAKDDVSTTELHLPKGKKIVFKLRSQDVLHSAYMPHFRAQMNCVPGMVTQFAFTPIKTTQEMREDDKIIEKVANINKIRSKKSAELVAKGESPLDPYTFDYLLLCNKICGASHYNMQMKIIVDTPQEFKSWISGKATILTAIANEKKSKLEQEKPKPVIEKVLEKKPDSTLVMPVAESIVMK